MFENVPDTWWWSAGANLTDWFDWDAVGAIGTFLALLFTIRLADRANRDARHRDAVFLAGVISKIYEALLPIYGGRAIYEQKIANRRKFFENSGVSEDVINSFDYDENFKADVIDSWEADRVFSYFKELDEGRFPTVSTLLIYKAAATNFTIIRESFDGGDEDWLDNFDKCAAEISTYHDELEREVGHRMGNPGWADARHGRTTSLLARLPLPEWLKMSQKSPSAD